MIVDIKKGGFAKGLIEYHEKKVTKGKAQLIMDTTLSQNKEQRISRIVGLAETNKSVKLKNKFVHISISFAKGEKVSAEAQRQIAEKYLEGMGYGNTPKIIYEHSDTGHNHFHIVTTTIDYDGKKVPDFNDHKRSQTLSREIEKQFGLQVTKYTKQEKTKVQEINAKKFKLLKGLQKLSSNDKAQREILEILTPAEYKKITTDKLSDSQIQSLVKLRDVRENSISQLHRIIRQFDAEYKTDKETLRDRLNYIKGLSNSREDFMENIKAQGLYVRKIAVGNNSFSLTYGLPETNFYINDKDLPISLRFDYLFTDKKISLVYDQESQKKYLKSMVLKVLKTSSTQKEFETALNKAGINYEYSENKGGIYGISFSSENLKEPTLFKGSQIGVSWNKISKDLNIPLATEKKTSINKSEATNNTSKISAPKGLSKLGKSLDTSNDDEAKKKRKNRDQEMERD